MKYYLGLDIGTNSVGYAVMDENYKIISKNCKKGNKSTRQNVFGAEIFDAAQTAKETRIFRGSKRRLNRRKTRITLLQDILSDFVLPKDPSFFIRLENSFFIQADRNEEIKNDTYTLFNDDDFTDVDYYNDEKNGNKTIYHLRKRLMNSNEKADERLIYLALHHIIKYRGNFLFEGQELNNSEETIEVLFEDLCNKLNECYEDIAFEYNVNDFKEIFLNGNISKKDKINTAGSNANYDKSFEDVVKGVFTVLVGNSSNADKIFEGYELKDDEGKSISIKFSDDNYELNKDIILAEIGEACDLLFSLEKLYSKIQLNNILDINKYGQTVADKGITISEVMIAKYNKHKADLSCLKALIKDNCSSDEYKAVFKDKTKDGYAGYISNRKKEPYERLKKFITLILNNIKNTDASVVETIKNIKKQLELETFLPLINTRENSAIPYQLHKQELLAIIKNQGRFYNTLLDNQDKIVKLLEFRVPYYVGPLNHKPNDDRFFWAVRRESGKITPWNFNDKIDIDKSATAFIERMTNNCTYLLNEKVLPKCSLLYQKFEVLNELNKIRVDSGSGLRLLSNDVKQKVYTELFANSKYKTISIDRFKNFLEKNCGFDTIKEVKGTQKEDAFSTSLSSYTYFLSKLGKVDETNSEMIEEIIYWATVFEDSKIFKRQLEKYKNELGDKIKEISKLRLRGWGRFSRKLLEELTSTEVKGHKNENLSIVDVMWYSNYNFIQVISDAELGFGKQIENLMEEYSETTLLKENIRKLPGSPAIKKSINQTFLIIKDVVKKMGCSPEAIFIEVTRDDKDNSRTVSRLKKLKDCYKALKSEVDEYNKDIETKLNTYKDNQLQADRLYLYFLQNGKCMYTGKPLEIDKLSEYEIDHILPQCYIKDDSIENRVLVLKQENQRKLDSMTLNSDIISRQRTFWGKLLKSGLIGKKKYDNLIRQSVSPEDKEKFINRQLVETSQIIKHIITLFKHYYTDVNIYPVKASLGSNFRKCFGFYKNRGVNDYHHAQDAYITAVIGLYTLNRFPNMYNDMLKNGYSQFFKNYKINNKGKYGFVIDSMLYNQCDEDGVVLWNAESDLATVRKCMGYTLCNIVKKTEIVTGGFYDQMPLSHENNKKRQSIRKNKNTGEYLDMSIYGGYSGIQMSYNTVVRTKDEEGYKYVFCPIPIFVANKNGTKEVEDYIKANVKNFDKIIMDYIPKYQQVIDDKWGAILLLPSIKGEIHNARQLVLDKKSNETIYFINHLQENKFSVEELNNRINDLYLLLNEKISTDYLLFDNVGEKLSKQKKLFDKLELKEKIYAINQILVITKVNGEKGNLKCIGLTNEEGRKKKILSPDKMTFVFKSPSGLYEERRRIVTDEE